MSRAAQDRVARAERARDDLSRLMLLVINLKIPAVSKALRPELERQATTVEKELVEAWDAAEP